MTWIAPEVTRIDEPFTGPERGMLDGFLDWQRGTLLVKCAGLSGSQLAQQAVPPSDLSLLGLVRHMTAVERSWFRVRFRGEDLPAVFPSASAAFASASADGAEADLAAYAAEVALARAAVAGASLDEEFTSPKWGQMSLRWIYTHMIEEYARHCGHADLLRERIDGVTGS